MDPIVATVVQSRCGGRRCWVARVRIPGRPVLVLTETPSREAAISAVRRRWPRARFGAAPSLDHRLRPLWADDVVAMDPGPSADPEREAGRWYRRWRRGER